MYNLAHVYLYDEHTNESINKSIELIRSTENEFESSIKMLCIIIIKKHGINLDNIGKDISQYTKNLSKFISSFKEIINNHSLDKANNLENVYLELKNIDYMYNIFLGIINSKKLFEEYKFKKSDQSNSQFNISRQFYEGFRFDIINNIYKIVIIVSLIYILFIKF